MSRSRKKNPVGWMCSHTNKGWKVESNRRLRRANKVRGMKGEEPKDLLEISDIWCSPSDGTYAMWERLPRFEWDIGRRKKMMRK